MKLRHILLCAAFTAATSISAQQINPITKAVLEGYEQTLKENPNDYETLYQRAAQYYNLSMYDNALADISRAIDATPAKESSLRLSEFSLLSDIQTELKQYQKALEAAEAALAINPGSYPDLYRKGNILLHLKDADAAYRTFSAMQRLKSRSQEAFFGMAKACLLQGKTQEATELIEQARAADPSSAITYCRLGDLYKEMNDPQQAAANYLSAFGLDNSSGRPLQSLIALGESDYQAVAEAIDYALTRSDNKIPLYFLQANIARITGNYQQAFDAFNQLLSIPAGQAPSVYASLGETCLALNQLDKAQVNIEAAVQADSSADNLLLKSRIELAASKPSSALVDAQKVLSARPSDTEARVTEALAYIQLKEYDKAIASLSDAILSDASDPLPVMLRAYIYSQLQSNAKAAAADYARIANMPAESFPGFAYKAIAKSRGGKKIDADAIIEEALRNNNGKDDYYWAAVYYGQTGDLDKARDMRDKAISSGFSNRYLLDADLTPGLNLQSIRHLK